MNDINIDDMKKMDPAQYLALDLLYARTCSGCG